MAKTGPSRRRLPPGDTREVLAVNLNRMMESRYKQSSNRPMALAKDAKVSLSTVQRTLARGNSTIDTIDAFARVFGVPAYQMLVPWGLLGEVAVKGSDSSSSGNGDRRTRGRSPAMAR